MKKNIEKFTVLIFVVTVSSCCLIKSRNPFEEVEWIEDTPGATERYVTFTPVLKANPKKILGPTVGADYAEICFEDLNNDGVKEVIIETDASFKLEIYNHEKHILMYKKIMNEEPKFVLLKSE